MDTAELLLKVRKIEIKTKRASRNLLSGGYHSAFRGRGMSFSEVRQYQYGDDVRAIDWNVTARTGEPHIKVFEEERELTVMLVVDVSGSSFFGTRQASKQQVLTEICAVLAFSAISNNDKVGLLLFSDRVEQFIPPQKGRQHILRIIRELVDISPAEKKTDLSAALQYLLLVLKKRSVCFILSDFQAPDFTHALRMMSRRHDCTGIHCWDPLERMLPDVGLLKIKDPENGQECWIDTTEAAFRRAYTQKFDEKLELLQKTFQRADVDWLSLSTTESYVQALLRFFAQRTHALTHG